MPFCHSLSVCMCLCAFVSFDVFGNDYACVQLLTSLTKGSLYCTMKQPFVIIIMVIITIKRIYYTPERQISYKLQEPQAFLAARGAQSFSTGKADYLCSLLTSEQ